MNNLNLYKIVKFDRKRIPQHYFVFAESEEDSWVKCAMVRGKYDSSTKVCGADEIYNIGRLFNEITRLVGDGVCVACGASVGEDGTFVGNYDR